MLSASNPQNARVEYPRRLSEFSYRAGWSNTFRSQKILSPQLYCTEASSFFFDFVPVIERIGHTTKAHSADEQNLTIAWQYHEHAR